jgi:hypothetical protein
MNVLYLIIGTGTAFIIPLGMLKLAIYYSDKQSKNGKR